MLIQAYGEVEAEEMVLGGGDVGGCVGAWSEAEPWTMGERWSEAAGRTGVSLTSHPTKLFHNIINEF